jgi:hypothetical protein
LWNFNCRKDEGNFMKKILNIVMGPKKSPWSEIFTISTYIMLKLVFEVDSGHKMTMEM